MFYLVGRFSWRSCKTLILSSLNKQYVSKNNLKCISYSIVSCRLILDRRKSFFCMPFHIRCFFIWFHYIFSISEKLVHYKMYFKDMYTKFILYVSMTMCVIKNKKVFGHTFPCYEKKYMLWICNNCHFWICTCCLYFLRFNVLCRTNFYKNIVTWQFYIS